MKKVALYNPYLDTKGGGEKICLALAQILHREFSNDVYLVTHGPMDLDDIGSYLDVDLTGIKVLQVNFHTRLMRLSRRMRLPVRIQTIVDDRKISTTVKREGFDVFINNCYQSNLPSPCEVGVYTCMFPQRLANDSVGLSLLKRIYVWLTRRLSRWLLHPQYRSPIDTYQLVTAISAYAQSYIREYWNRKSVCIFPICEDMKTIGSTGEKEKIILHVGRFFENVFDRHAKRQDFLLETFARLAELQEDGWKLVFVGGVGLDLGALRFILSLMEAARELPVEFRFNCPFPELKSLYNRASIYWHATGYESDSDEHPEKQEHFGIVTVEAMSAGCIPIVINSAGQKETVTHGVNGFLWRDPKELINETINVAHMAEVEIRALREAAESSAKAFSRDEYRKRVVEVYGPLCS